MRIPIENLPSEGRTFPLHFSREDVNGLLGALSPEDVRAVADLTGEARALPSGKDVFVLGRIGGRVACRCVRCLEVFEQEVSAEFHRVYTEAEDVEGAEMQLRREDLDVEPIEGGAIDLSRLIAEELSLALTSYPVCRESCQGLCPQCGGNRNLGECRCGDRTGDPRFSALESLIRKRKAEG